MIILLGDTVAARKLSEQLKDKDIEFLRMPTWTEEYPTLIPSVVIDADHPSRSVKFSTLRVLCEQKDIPYLKLERPETKIPTSPLIHSVPNWEEALLRLEERVEVLYQKKQRAITLFVTTGSHHLESIARRSFSHSVRLVVRVLPQGHLVQKCQDMGLQPKDILAMQGPFSKEINKSLFKFYGADLVLTRDSGLAGGTDTKISAALELGLEIVLIKKNQTGTGLVMNTIQEVLDWIDNKRIDNNQPHMIT